MIASSILGISLLSYYVFGQESRYAKKYANELFDYPLPTETVVLEKGYNVFRWWAPNSRSLFEGDD